MIVKDKTIHAFEKQNISFCSKKYNFRKFLQELFDCECLENIHETHKHLMPNSESLSRPWPFNENSLDIHQIFYNKLNEPWDEIISLYEDFIENHVSILMDGGFLYQKFPTFRVHLPDLQAVTKWHYDADEDHGHPFGEINFILPLTDMYSTNATWCETEHLKGDYQPMEANMGELIRFNGNVLRHGNKPNKTGRTRFSFDFRILPEKHTPAIGLFPDSFGASAIRNKKWEDGGYYKKFTRKQDV
jgi:ectoine hydroxylase-related dioxygenase (phytanoyl-CoA dioxygenase family)